MCIVNKAHIRLFDLSPFWDQMSSVMLDSRAYNNNIINDFFKELPVLFLNQFEVFQNELNKNLTSVNTDEIERIKFTHELNGKRFSWETRYFNLIRRRNFHSQRNTDDKVRSIIVRIDPFCRPLIATEKYESPSLNSAYFRGNPGRERITLKNKFAGKINTNKVSVVLSFSVGARGGPLGNEIPQ